LFSTGTILADSSYGTYIRIIGGGVSGRRNTNTGAIQPPNTATLPGTWRALSPTIARFTIWDSMKGITSLVYHSVAVQRIS
jgi:hypothetical protein